MVEFVAQKNGLRSRHEPAVDYEDFFENGGIGLHMVDADGRILHANNAELKLLGYTAADYIGRDISDFHTDQHVIRDILLRLKRGESIQRYPARMRARDGSVRDVEISSSGQVENGQLVHSRCFTVDVTTLRTTERAIGQREARFHQTLEALPVAVYTTDAAGKITYINRKAAELAGREPKIGEDEWWVAFRLFTAEGQELPHDVYPMAITLKENRPVRNIEAVAQRPDGTFFPFLPFPTPLRDDDGNLVGAVNVLLDLTDRKRGEDAVQHLSAIVESSFDAIVSKDLNGTIKSWNQGAERLFGFDAAEAIGQHISMLIPLDRQDEEPRIIERIRRGERIESHETIRLKKNGDKVPVSLTISPVRNAAGRIVGASKIARDITATKESEHRIRTLMREVNHRVKNQYSVILSMIRETNKRSDSPDRFERQVRERIMALSRSHDLLVSADWKGATIGELVLAQAKPFDREDAITMAGPPITLSPNAVQYLGIAFHELCTNSAKYGVLSGHQGIIAVTWGVAEDHGVQTFKLVWAEQDGPQIKSITKSGFGSVVLKRVAPQAMSGTGELKHGSNDIVWTLEAPIKFVEASLFDEYGGDHHSRAAH
ncbi:PAS domain S-box protein [Mesorhizobium sp.]|uniref:PAS domain S-box protein n=1 Tax=Mesorhizobium sp. TaxID=1871066 RepID=UPI000FEA0885|nr:PAS domain S-box protein [Mesorhizobium sp.]RWC28432.1 MAG: PAS domain S-box protein [Mesorhizobium sp.]TIX23271.1 MAG: PAS domain S-box protein [Mesorhizobium sp.]